MVGYSLGGNREAMETTATVGAKERELGPLHGRYCSNHYLATMAINCIRIVQEDRATRSPVCSNASQHFRPRELHLQAVAPGAIATIAFFDASCCTVDVLIPAAVGITLGYFSPTRVAGRTVVPQDPHAGSSGSSSGATLCRVQLQLWHSVQCHL